MCGFYVKKVFTYTLPVCAVGVGVERSNYQTWPTIFHLADVDPCCSWTAFALHVSGSGNERKRDNQSHGMRKDNRYEGGTQANNGGTSAIPCRTGCLGLLAVMKMIGEVTTPWQY